MNALLSNPSVIGATMFALAMIVAIPGMLSVVRSARNEEQVMSRLQRGGQRGQLLNENRNQSRIGKAVIGFGQNAAPEDEGEVSAIRSKLMRAGFPHSSAIGKYYFARFVCVVVPQFILLMALPYMESLPDIVPLVSCLVLIIAGLALPSFWVQRRIEARQQACSQAFPDMMDLLVACVEAGLSLDASVQRVAEELTTRHPVLSEHMKSLSLQMRAGRSRRDAWRTTADRMGIEEARSLATMLRQAEEMGTSLGATLRVFSADMRKRRILRAEEQAMALPAKLTVPLVVFVFPVLLGVLILPAIVQLQGIFGN